MAQQYTYKSWTKAWGGWLCFCVVLVSAPLAAQQRPYYTQYILNNYLINPAVVGIENYWDVKMSHRRQWVGLPDAPLTTYLTVQGPLKKDAYERESPTAFRARGENPRGQAYWRDYQAADPHAGVGFTAINDQTGPLNRFAAMGSFAYHLPLSPTVNLSGGISVGFTNMSLDAAKLNFYGTTVDPVVAGSNVINRIKPDVSAGLWLYSRDYFLGLAAQQLIPQNLSFSDNTVSLTQGRLVPHLFLSAGYRLALSEELNLLPSVLVRYISPLPVGFDVNAKLQYLDLAWVGASYRNKDGFAAMLGMNISHSFNIGYSYDVQTSRINTISRGTHEILLGFQIGNRYGDWCPRKLW